MAAGDPQGGTFNAADVAQGNAADHKANTSQPSVPGGRREPTDISNEQAAYQECFEETDVMLPLESIQPAWCGSRAIEGQWALHGYAAVVGRSDAIQKLSEMGKTPQRLSRDTRKREFITTPSNAILCPSSSVTRH